jgi:hypothetical protein
MLSLGYRACSNTCGEGTCSSTDGCLSHAAADRSPLLKMFLEDPLVHGLRFFPDNAIVEEMNCRRTREERGEEDISFENLIGDVIVQQYL